MDRAQPRAHRRGAGLAKTPFRDASLADVQSRLGADKVLLEFWVGSRASAVLWIGGSSAGVVRGVAPSGQSISSLLAALQSWRQRVEKSVSIPGEAVAGECAAAAPSHHRARRSFERGSIEALRAPAADALRIEQHDVTYLPSARFLMRSPAPALNRSPPWRRQLVALGDPPVAAADRLAEFERWAPLTASATEIHGIARLLPGRSQIHLGGDARKHYLQAGGVRGVPLLHFSTHAVVDDDNPDRSRILLAADSTSAAFDYLFESEVYDLDLNGVDLVTVSACDTGARQVDSRRGRGGVQPRLPGVGFGGDHHHIVARPGRIHCRFHAAALLLHRTGRNQGRSAAAGQTQPAELSHLSCRPALLGSLRLERRRMEGESTLRVVASAGIPRRSHAGLRWAGSAAVELALRV